MSLDFPKTLIIDLSKGYGGSTTRVLNLVKNLPENKIGLACFENSELAQHAKQMNIPFYSVGKRKFDPQILWRLISIIRENQFKILDTQNIQSKFWASLATTFTDTVVVSTLHSWYKAEHGANLRGRIYQWIEFKTNRKLYTYICVSSVDYNRLLDAGISEESVQLIHNIAEIDPAKIESNRKQILEDFDFPQDTILSTSVGRLVWPKGYEDLIEAIRLVADKHPELRCLIIGDGPLKDSLQQQIQDAGMEDRIKLAGFMDRGKVLPIVKISDIFAMPSRSEGTPIALLEAARLGRPIIASDAGGIPELVKDGQEAILIQIGDINALADGLSLLCTDKQLALKIGQQAASRSEHEFSLTSLINSTTHVYKGAFGNG